MVYGRPNPADDSVELAAYWAIFARRRWMVLGIAVLVVIVGMSWLKAQRPVYKATAKVLITTSNPFTNADTIPSLANLQALTSLRSVETQIELISSAEVLNEAFASLPERDRRQWFGTTELPSWAVRINNPKDTDIIEIIVRANAPRGAAELANAVARSYAHFDRQQFRQAVGNVCDDIQVNLRQMRGEMAQTQSELAAFKRRSGLVNPDTQLAKTAEYTANLQVEIGQARTEVSGNQATQHLLGASLRREQQLVLSSETISENPQYAAIRERIGTLENQRAELLHDYLPQSPEVKSLDERILDERVRLKQVAHSITSASVRQRNTLRDGMLRDYLTAQASGTAASARLHALTQELQANQRALQILPEQERRLSELLRRSTLLQNTYDMLWQRYYALVVSEKTQLPGSRLVSPALPPQQRSQPDPLQTAGMLALVGMVAGGMTAVRMDRSRRRGRKDEHQAPLLALMYSPPPMEDDRRQEIALRLLAGEAIRTMGDETGIDIARLALWQGRVRQGVLAAIRDGLEDASADAAVAATARILRGEALDAVAAATGLDIARLALWQQQAARALPEVFTERDPDVLAMEVGQLQQRLQEALRDNVRLRDHERPA